MLVFTKNLLTCTVFLQHFSLLAVNHFSLSSKENKQHPTILLSTISTPLFLGAALQESFFDKEIIIMSHDHSHSHGHAPHATSSASAENSEQKEVLKRLKQAMCLCAGFLVVEVIGGYYSGSLAVLSDAAQ